MLKLMILGFLFFPQAFSESFQNPHESELFAAVRQGDLRVVKYFFERGSDLLEENKQKESLLHVAASYNRVEIMDFLLKNTKKLYLTRKDLLGNTPLHEAAWAGSLDIVKMLTEYGADINDRNSSGVSVVSRAVFMGHEDIFDFLIKNGASIHLKDNIGRTALHDAAYKGHYGIVKKLVLQGIHVDAKDRRNKTALYYSFNNSLRVHVDVFQLLIKSGASFHLKDENGKSLYQLALNEPRLRNFMMGSSKNYSIRITPTQAIKQSLIYPVKRKFAKWFKR